MFLVSGRFTIHLGDQVAFRFWGLNGSCPQRCDSSITWFYELTFKVCFTAFTRQHANALIPQSVELDFPARKAALCFILNPHGTCITKVGLQHPEGVHIAPCAPACNSAGNAQFNALGHAQA